MQLRVEHILELTIYIVSVMIHCITTKLNEQQNPWRKLDDECLCLSCVFGSVLTCFRSSLTRFADFLSDSKAFLTFHCILRLPSISILSIACTTVLQCGHTLLNRSVTNVCSTENHNTACSSHLITHYCFVRVTESTQNICI